MEIKRNSWVYKLAVGRDASFGREWRRSNVCALIRGALFESANYLGLILFSAFAFSLALYSLGDFLAWVAAMSVNSSWVYPNPGAMIFGTLLGFSVLFAAGYLISRCFISAGKSVESIKAVKAVYGAVSGKFCTVVEFVD